jgi:hypothetical protein
MRVHHLMNLNLKNPTIVKNVSQKEQEKDSEG